MPKRQQNQPKMSGRKARHPTAVPQIAVRTGGPQDPPAITSRPWNRAVLSGTFVTGGVGGDPIQATTIASELISQVCPGATAANLEFRIRKIEAWGTELITSGLTYNSAVSLDVYNFVGGTGVGSTIALSLQDTPSPNHRAHVHAQVAPYTHIGSSTQLIFRAQVATGQSALSRITLDWRYNGSEGPGPLFASVIPARVART